MVLWASVGAAVAGIAAVAAMIGLRRVAFAEHSVASQLRDVQCVLSDCYDKIKEIEDQLPDALAAGAHQKRARVRAMSNGTPSPEV